MYTYITYLITYTTTTKHPKINQVTELTPEETENPLGGYGRTVAHVVIGLKTTKGSKQLRLDPSIYESLQVCVFIVSVYVHIGLTMQFEYMYRPTIKSTYTHKTK